MAPFTRVLVANRGEIALRIVRACHEEGLESVAVYSDADRLSPHVRAAHRAVPIGAAPAAESYLDIAKLLEAARATDCQAVHPGYGFLSERAPFAEAVTQAGLTFIGPPATAIRAMGDKTEARRRMQAAGVPIVPGTTRPVADHVQAKSEAERLGYPVLLKAIAGGGGKGMRLIREPGEIESAFEAAQSEALKAFGAGELYVEKYLERPRHIEVQVLADTYGRVVALGERECSIQRRHQKLIEEAPSVAVTPALRRRLNEAATAAAGSVGYLGAGTIEFLLAPTGEFYFLEMNTRLQVEHPVTELVYGVDIVREQLRVAQGHPLRVHAGALQPRGHAIECRITAEDPFNDFLPVTGVIRHLQPPSGPGVRWDGGVEAGNEVTLFYDSLLAKLIVWGGPRAGAAARDRRGAARGTTAHRGGAAGVSRRSARWSVALAPRRPPGKHRRVSEVVTITAIATGGDGVGRLADGRAVFVPRAAPGERVRLRDGVQLHKHFARGELAEIVGSGADRVAASCPHYVSDRCGGCQLQHLTYDAQLAAKRAIVGDALRRIGKLDVPDPEIVEAVEEWRYRAKVSLAVEGGRGRSRAFGFHPYDQPGRVFSLVDCHITDFRLMALWRELKPRLDLLPSRLTRLTLRLDRDGRRHILAESGGEPWLDAERLRAALPQGDTVICWWRPADGAARVVAGPATGFPATAFEQVHPEMALVARRWAVDQLGDLRGAVAWDLYGGIGDTAVHLAGRGAQVVSVDADERAVEWARGRASERPIRFIAGRAEDVLPTLPDPNVVVVNPPGAGLHWNVTLRLTSQPVAHVIYLSCDPATLARDLHRLRVNYRITAVRAFDLFPQTAHVETVVVLEGA